MVEDWAHKQKVCSLSLSYCKIIFFEVNVLIWSTRSSVRRWYSLFNCEYVKDAAARYIIHDKHYEGATLEVAPFYEY